MVEIVSVSQISEHGVRELNEDAVLVNEASNTYAIFDGASSLAPYTSNDGKTGAYLAAHIAAETFAGQHESLKSAAVAANNAIEQAHKVAGIDITRNINRFGTTAIALRFSNGKAEVLSIGDSVALFIYKDGHVELPIPYHDQDIKIMRKWRQLANNRAVNIRQLINDDLLALRQSANSTDGYGLLNGDTRAEAYLKTSPVSLTGVKAVLLLSDGMYLPKANPEEDEDWQSIAKAYADGGLEGILRKVRSIEDGDPDLTKYPRYKVHDDASGIAIDLK